MMRTVPQSSGWLEVVCGSMFSGKSEELIRRMVRAQIARQNVYLCKPSIDDRYDATCVASHNGRKLDAHAVSSVQDILQGARDAEVVGIDEVQFLDPEIVYAIEQLVQEGKRVVVSGLDTDFRGEPFGVMPLLLARAEFVDKLQAVCHRCTGPATRTQRLVEGKPVTRSAPLIVVGALESYEARCRACHEVPDA